MSVVQYGHSNEGVWGYSPQGTAAVLWGTWRLVNDTELYNVAVDPGQSHDVSSAHPETASRMRDYYEEWWSGVGRNLDVYQRLTIGSERENPMRLCSADWAWVSPGDLDGYAFAATDRQIIDALREGGGQLGMDLSR